MSLLWAATTRGTTVLAECGEDNRGGAVLSLAQRILRKKPTPGWESDREGSLRALKFHVYSSAAAGPPASSSGAGSSSSGRADPIMWTICCVFDAEYPELQARATLSINGTVSVRSPTARASRRRVASSRSSP